MFEGIIASWGITLVVVAFVLTLLIFAWAIYALISRWNRIPTWAKIVGVIALLVGWPPVTLIVVYVTSK